MRTEKNKLSPGPNPHAGDPLHVAPFGKAWALVEGLGVISAHKTKDDADRAYIEEQHRRADVLARYRGGAGED